MKLVTPLLLRAANGKSNKLSFILPPDGFIYDKSTKGGEHGAGDLINFRKKK